MNITIIGMPGSGKSCMARALSSKLKMKNIDGDKLIKKVTKRELQDIINEDGLEEFKKIEEDILLTIPDSNLIVSPGGSAVYYESVMKHFKSMGPIVYLHVTPQNLIKRLGDFSRRGIVLKPGQTIEDLYNERLPLFEKYADITVNCDGTAYSKYQKDALEKIQNYLK